MAENARGKLRVVQRNVEIPVRVLGAEDCDPSLKPPSWSSFAGRAFEFKVPSGSEPGCLLRIPIKDETLVIPLPGVASEGDTLCMADRSDGSWRVVRKTKAFSFVLPRTSSPGDQLRLHVPDGGSLLFAVPQGAEPDDLIYLKLDENGWNFDSICKLPDLELYPPPLEWVSGPYTDMLKFLNSKDVFTSVPMDEDGILHISVPFCGNLHEYRVLANFIANNFLCLPGVKGARIFCTEVCDRYALEWATVTKWYAQAHPTIHVDLCVKDLAQDPLPDAGLTIGVHPEVTKGGYWFQIIGSILQSSASGLCVFATFFEVEMKTLVNMVKMYRGEVASIEVFDNPHYEANAKPASPPLCYIVLVRAAT